MTLRVEIPAYLDTWMRGARYGTVTKTYWRKWRDPFTNKEGRDEFARIKMDHPQARDVVALLSDCKVID
jgi:hypothetical protein